MISSPRGHVKGAARLYTGIQQGERAPGAQEGGRGHLPRGVA